VRDEFPYLITCCVGKQIDRSFFISNYEFLVLLNNFKNCYVLAFFCQSRIYLFGSSSFYVNESDIFVSGKNKLIIDLTEFNMNWEGMFQLSGFLDYLLLFYEFQKVHSVGDKADHTMVN